MSLDLAAAFAYQDTNGTQSTRHTVTDENGEIVDFDVVDDDLELG